MRACVLFAALTCLAGPAAAQTYKWVDAKGVVSYSNRPPAEAARYAQRVPELLSVYESDRELARAAARLAYRERIAEEEWLQRQRLMALSASYTQDLGYHGDYYGHHTALFAPPVRVLRSIRSHRRF